MPRPRKPSIPERPPTREARPDLAWRPRANVEDEVWSPERRAEAAKAARILARNGWPVERVAALLGLSTRTVKRYLGGGARTRGRAEGGDGESSPVPDPPEPG